MSSLHPFRIVCLLAGHGRLGRTRTWVVERQNPFGQTYRHCSICGSSSRRLPRGRGPERHEFYTPSPLERSLRYFADRWSETSIAAAHSLAAYRRAVADLPRPTEAQIDAFVEFVASAHSWYKHLPLFPPGSPFTFFLNPKAGMDTFVTPSGEVVYCERTDDSQRFHYTWMTTAAYCARFGYLDYATDAGRTFVHRTSNGPAKLLATRAPAGIPQAIRNAGTMNLTGVVHPMAAGRSLQWVDLSNASWPEESGGSKTMHQIQRIVVAPGFWEQDLWLEDVHRELEQLFVPERSRLKSQMRRTIRAMLDVL